MRTVVFGVVGTVLLVGGFAVGVGGLGLSLTSGCSTTYQLSMTDASDVEDPPTETVAFDSLTDYQQSAVTAALESGSAVTVRDREPLEPLTAVVVEVDGERYVAALGTNPCRSPYGEITIGGFAAAIVGFFAVFYAYLLRRLR
jgi:hypothetical protein